MNAQRQVSLGTFAADGATKEGIASVTFIPGATFSGTISGMTFASTNTPLTISAPAGDFLSPIAITRSAGTLNAIYVS